MLILINRRKFGHRHRKERTTRRQRCRDTREQGRRWVGARGASKVKKLAGGGGRSRTSTKTRVLGAPGMRERVTEGR